MAEKKQVKLKKFRVREGGLVGGEEYQAGDIVELPESMMAHAGEGGPLEAVDGSKPEAGPENGGIPTEPDKRVGSVAPEGSTEAGIAAGFQPGLGGHDAKENGGRKGKGHP